MAWFMQSLKRDHLILTLTLRDGCVSHVVNRKLQLKVRDLPTNPELIEEPRFSEPRS